jgi:hypothetical protein
MPALQPSSLADESDAASMPDDDTERSLDVVGEDSSSSPKPATAAYPEWMREFVVDDCVICMQPLEEDAQEGGKSGPRELTFTFHEQGALGMRLGDGGRKGQREVLISGVVPGSPAERKGVPPDSVIVRMNGDPLVDLFPRKAFSAYDVATKFSSSCARPLSVTVSSRFDPKEIVTTECEHQFHRVRGQ